MAELPEGAIPGNGGRGYLIPFRKGDNRASEMRKRSDRSLYLETLKLAREMTPAAIRRLGELAAQSSSLAVARAAAMDIVQIAWGKTPPPSVGEAGDSQLAAPYEALSTDQLEALRSAFGTMAEAADAAAAADAELAARENAAADAPLVNPAPAAGDRGQ